MIDFKKFNLDTIGSKPKKRNNAVTISERVKENQLLLQRCMMHWMALQDFRDRAIRNHKYYRGDQWHEKMTHPDTDEVITEEAYIRSQGRIPLKQNIIRIMVKNILGQFRVNKTKTMVISRTREGASESEMLTNSLNAVHDVNQARELDARELEKFLNSGAAGYRIRFEHFKTRNTEDVKFTPVNLFQMFFNTDINDIRLEGMRLIGMFHDMDPDSVLAAFSTDPKQAEKIKEWYKGAADKNAVSTIYGLDAQRIKDLNFMIPNDLDKWRVYEVWELKAEWRLYVHDYLDGSYKIETERTHSDLVMENQKRIQMAEEVGIPADKVPLMDISHKYDQYWYGKYLTPMGDVLWEGETTYEHGEHPFVLLLYPLTNGEVWGFTEDIIDQQRYINRLISMIDFIIGNSAKGVLLAPEGSVPDDEDPASWAAKWSKFDGVLFYKPKPGVPIPQQVSANSVNIGANELLALQMRLMNEISGVHGAIQGQAPKAGTPSSLYAQEAQNATLNTLDMLETFNWFRQRRDYKALKVVVQHYGKRNILISGADYDKQASQYDPEKAKNMEWDLVLTQSLDAPAYRHMVDNLLYELLTSQAIDIEMFLENSAAPFADKMLAQIRAKKKEAEEMGMAPDMNGVRELMPQVQQEAQQRANPVAMQQIDGVLK